MLLTSIHLAAFSHGRRLAAATALLRLRLLQLWLRRLLWLRLPCLLCLLNLLLRLLLLWLLLLLLQPHKVGHVVGGLVEVGHAAGAAAADAAACTRHERGHLAGEPAALAGVADVRLVRRAQLWRYKRSIVRSRCVDGKVVDVLIIVADRNHVVAKHVELEWVAIGRTRVEVVRVDRAALAVLVLPRVRLGAVDLQRAHKHVFGQIRQDGCAVAKQAAKARLRALHLGSVFAAAVLGDVAVDPARHAVDARVDLVLDRLVLLVAAKDDGVGAAE
mmetsp:Transcript_15668/g.46259  ORF Transcript_15668/g.46259 Transcript_15668/m.46259 type:complete len:274 (-) Transcript_15668:522-1343(-)